MYTLNDKRDCNGRVRVAMAQRAVTPRLLGRKLLLLLKWALQLKHGFRQPLLFFSTAHITIRDKNGVLKSEIEMQMSWSKSRVQHIQFNCLTLLPSISCRFWKDKRGVNNDQCRSNFEFLLKKVEIGNDAL